MNKIVDLSTTDAIKSQLREVKRGFCQQATGDHLLLSPESDLFER